MKQARVKRGEVFKEEQKKSFKETAQVQRSNQKNLLMDTVPLHHLNTYLISRRTSKILFTLNPKPWKKWK